MNTMHRQCCVCLLPATPKGMHEHVTHGYHRGCFMRHHANDFTLEEMKDLLSAGGFVDEEEDDMDTQLKVAPVLA